MRLFAALGEGDIVAAQRKEIAGAGSATQTSMTFSGQLYQYCTERGIPALFTSRCPNNDTLDTESVRLVNVPRFWEMAGGWRYHCSRVLYASQLALMAKRFRADVALIDSGTAHYFALAAFRLLGIQVAVNFHNVRWPSGFEPRGLLGKIIRALDSWGFRHIVFATLGCSPECRVQAQADGATNLPYFGWCAQYLSEGFDPSQVDSVRTPFRLLFSGRIEEFKGVFDLIRISALLRKRCSVPVVIDVCGDGSALPALRDAIKLSGEVDRIFIHGKLGRADLLRAYRRAHAVIVPTRGNFCEGMPLVCAEAVLSGRPVITSRLSNALPVIGSAIAEAKPEDIDSYVDAVCRLIEVPEEYERLHAACPAMAAQFLDPRRGYTTAVDQLLKLLQSPSRALHR